MELKTIIVILVFILISSFGVFIFGFSVGLIFIVAEKIQDWL